MIRISVAVPLLLAALLVACSGESDQERQTRDKLADTDQSPVTSCNWENMEKQRINLLSYVDEADVCNTIQSTLGNPPSVALTRRLSKAIFIMQVNGSKDTAKEVAYQIMSVVEARGQTQNEKAIEGSIETVFKIFNGTQGHVTPKDVNVFLRNAGPMAKTLNDDGLIGMAAIIWEEKKAHGE